MIICVDFGGSYTKIALDLKSDKNKNIKQSIWDNEDKEIYADNRYILKKIIKPSQDSYDEAYLYINEKINEYHCDVIVTGARAGFADFSRINAKIEIIDEIPAVGNIAGYTGHEKAVVVNIGTGTPYVFYDKGKVQHFCGTGIGGGTFVGLSERLLGMSDLEKVTKIALNGKQENVNISINDISVNEFSWLKKNFTVSNFGKPAGGSKADVARAIHSIVAEPVASIAAGINKGMGLDTVVFCGAVCENGLIREILKDTLEVFGCKAEFVRDPAFGTCFGAIYLYCTGTDDSNLRENQKL